MCSSKDPEKMQHDFSQKCAENHHIKMISEALCVTEDWSNDAENSALHHRNKLHLEYINRKQYSKY